MAAAPIAGGQAFQEAMAASFKTDPAPSLAQAARRKGRFFGAAIRMDQLDADPELRDAVLHECSSLTPEIHFNWNSFRYHKDSWWFEHADSLVALAQKHDLHVRGHSLLWEQTTPKWALRQLARTKDWGLVQTFFKEVLPRYEGKIHEWDVVNEPIDSERGIDGLRTTIFYKAFGPSYIERAMREARRWDRKSKLFINEYGFDYDNPVEEDRRTLFLKLVERLKRDGVPLDGVGVQAHLDLSKGPFKPHVVRNFLKELRGFGVDIVITELDVKEHDKGAPLPLRDKRVAAEARSFVEVALDEPAVTGIVTWGLSDRHSWLEDQSKGLPSPDRAHKINRGLPYDARLERKDMYYALRDAFLQA
ncbi:endo-1,4-beta-xylanase [Allosphingosinicella flava]|uniref:Beta-xylanase n=1 Tax=Allosphingosinicella flava TaxID=2771430 RepID=A0A7T2LMC7_9SPHN|nr:endo-1,4-beta-xylanase [Sphingosinicella flava]QPQ55419.1 endo-1,4-beta-xylanase [Sphingosinicella flava]